MKNWSRGVEKKFVRTCVSSPKDVCDCIFKTNEKALRCIEESPRTNSSEEHGHYFVRPVVDIDIEARCFYHKHKLRAVSLYQWLDGTELKDFRVKVLQFFEKYKMPYNSAVIEICKLKGEDSLRIVEFNSFGIGQFSGASEFDWLADKDILYHSETPEFRMEFDF